jgi:aminotransferase
MTRLSEEYSAINLSQGMPDFDPPPELISAAVDAIRNGYNQYPITWGQPSLREAIAKKVQEFNKIDTNPHKNVTVTCGSTEAMTAAVLGLTDPGDKVVVADPFYENYVPDGIIAGAELLYVPFVGKALRLDEERLKDVMSQKPRLIIINTPNNPTGRVLELSELKLIADLCEESNCIAVTDEIYEHITYNEKRHISLASVGNMLERTVTVSGASKTYSVTGWRVGWAVAEEKLSNAIRKVHDYLTIGAPTPFQEALAIALKFPNKFYDELAGMYDEKRKRIMNTLEACNINYTIPEGAYYVLAEAPARFVDGQAFATFLLEKARVAVLPAVALYHDRQLGNQKVRLAFCKKDNTLEEVDRQLRAASSEI